jgi:hypothetical protein
MKKVMLGIVAYTIFGTMAMAQSPGRDLAALAFASEDSNEDGFVSLGEHQEQAINIFLSMDANDDGLLSWREFSFWGFGMELIADDSHRSQAYETARKVVFDLWDRSDNWKLTQKEQLRGITADFFQADAAFGVTHLSAQTSSEGHGNAALHCQHFPADCEETKNESKDTKEHEDHESGGGAFASPLEPGQGMFGAISEVNTIIEESGADWTKVDLDALWEHLKDMDALMTFAKVEKSELDDGLKMLVTGEGAADRAVRNMIPAHSQFLKNVRPAWEISVSGEGASYEVVVTSSDPSEAQKIKALGFAGFMFQDDHHASHHLGIAVGDQVH